MANLRANNLCGTGFVSANDGTVWSDYVTSTTGSTLSNYPATYGFDGNLSNFVYADNNSTMTWTPPNGGIKAGLIEVYVYAGNTHPLVRVNGVNTGAVVGSDLGQQGNWVDVTNLVDGHLKTIEADGYVISGTARSSGWSAVRINGEILVDGEQGTTGGRNAITGAVYFGGDNDTGGLTIADTTDLELGSETNWTIEFWIKLNHSALSDWDVVMGKGSDDGGGVEYEWFVEVMSGDHLIFLSTTAGNPWDFNQQITPALVVGEWYHVAIVRNGSGANTLKSYVNGVQYSTHTSQNIYTGNDEFGIGHFGHTNGLNSDVTLSNVRVVKGTSVYTAAFTPPTEKLTVIPNTVLLCCNDSADATQEKTGKTITVVGNAKATKDTPPVGVDAGVTFEGDTKINSQGHMYFPTGNTEQRGRGRGLIVANYIAPANTNVCEYVTIQSMGNSVDFGDTSAAVRSNAVFASSTRAVSGSGYVAPAQVNTIEYFTIATTGNATNFGDLNGNSGNYTPISNQTRGIFAGGYAYPALFNNIDYVTIATTGNSADFGGLATLRADSNRTAVNSTTRGLIGAGYISPTGSNIIEFLTIATTGNSSDFGDLTAVRSNLSGFCSNTRGVFAGGSNPTNNIMDYVTIASTGNASDFGDLICDTTLQASSATSNNTRGLVVAGDNQPANSITNTIQHVTIASTGNAQDFGDCLTTGAYRGMTSDSHGGLS